MVSDSGTDEETEREHVHTEDTSRWRGGKVTIIWELISTQWLSAGERTLEGRLLRLEDARHNYTGREREQRSECSCHCWIQTGTITLRPSLVV